MCGIVGIIERKKESIDREVLERMNNSLTHRGPDFGQICIPVPYIGLAHRRLSIIDLSKRANQPMISEDGRYCLVYNGEIYNYKQIKKDLIALGEKNFYTQSDTEVVLKAYIQWQERAFERFNGMFALAIYDRLEEKVILARDRYGIKPLYYIAMGNTFLFASEQRAFCEFPKFKKALDLETVKEYFTFQNIFTNHTFYQDVHLLESGTYMEVPLQESNQIRKIRYWDFDFQESQNDVSEEEYIEELERLFKNAVKQQLVSDVPVGTYLSGGMDSGAITAVAAQEIPFIKSFTCGFDMHSVSGMERGFDEREKAEHLSYHCKSEHYEVILKAGDMQRIMEKIVWHIEEPRVGQSYPNYFAAKLASKFVKVVLSGAGGDELFGGYPWRYYRSVNNQSFTEYVDKYYSFWQRLLPNESAESFFAPIWQEVRQVDTKEIFRNVFQKSKTHLTSPEECVNHSLYFEAKTFLHGLLVVEDKLSMAHGLETRAPFLDNELVDFAMKIPVKMKLNNLEHIISLNENDIGAGGKAEQYFKKTKDGKTILRKSMDKIIPKETLQGIKQGFSAPDASWYKNESMDYVRSIIENNNSAIYQFLDKKTVQDLVGEHLTGASNRRLLIWSLLYFDQWCNLFL